MMRKRTKSLIFITAVLMMIVGQPVVSADSLELIEWHESVKKDAIFAWKITTVDFVNESMESFMDGLIIQMKFITSPPGNPDRIFNSTESPDWVNIYINGFKIDLGMMGGMGAAFTQLISPTVYHFDNGTSFTLEEIHRLENTSSEIDTYYTVESGFVNITMGNETMKFTTFTNIETGIAANVSMYMEEMGYFVLEYYVQAANVDDSGETTSIDDDYTNFQDPLVMFRNLILLVGGSVTGVIVLIVGYIIYRRRKSVPVIAEGSAQLEVV